MMQNFIHNFKKTVFSKTVIGIIMASVVAVPLISLAAVPCDPGQLCNPLKATSFTQLINDLLGVIVEVGTPIAAVFFVYAGFTFVTALGEPKKLETAKNMFWWTVIGAAIVIGAQIILIVLTNTITNITK